MEAPGILPSLSFQGIPPQEEKIIRKLAQVWFISFIRKAEFKNSNYYVVFAKPTDNLVDRFHFNREVLVIFSSYDKFEGRTLDFVDKTINDFQNRLDKLCILIVSKDVEIKK